MTIFFQNIECEVAFDFWAVGHGAKIPCSRATCFLVCFAQEVDQKRSLNHASPMGTSWGFEPPECLRSQEPPGTTRNRRPLSGETASLLWTRPVFSEHRRRTKKAATGGPSGASGKESRSSRLNRGSGANTVYNIC